MDRSQFLGRNRPPRNPARSCSRKMHPEATSVRSSSSGARLVSAIARGRRWLDDVVSGRITTVADLCAREKCSVNLLITARCALLASEWKENDQQYARLHTKFEGALKAELKARFDRYALLKTWDFQTPKNCTFDEEAHGATGADIPAAVEQHVTENHFAPEDFEVFWRSLVSSRASTPVRAPGER